MAPWPSCARSGTRPACSTPWPASLRRRRIEIAEAAADLDERYVREWLGGHGRRRGRRACATPRVSRPGRHLPPAPRARRPVDQSGRTAQPHHLLPVHLRSSARSRTRWSSRSGAGEGCPTPATRPIRFTLMAESSWAAPGRGPDSARWYRWCPTAGRAAGGRDRRGRRRLRQWPGPQPVGRPPSPTVPVHRVRHRRVGAIERAQGRGRRRTVTANVEFVARDAADLGEVERFDLAFSFDAIHDQAHPDRMLAGVNRRPPPRWHLRGRRAEGLQPPARQRSIMPTAPMMYTISTMHCMTVSLAEGGMGLGTAWGEQRAREMLDRGRVRRHRGHRHQEPIAANHYLLATQAGGGNPRP